MAQPERTLYEGVCRGGPLDGLNATSRYPAGLLAVDRVAGRCWVYDYTSGEFTAREVDGRDLDNERRYRAADEPHYDVVAVP